MSQPLLATNRITLSYTVIGFAHKMHAYCIRGFDTPAGVPQVTFRDGVTGLEWEDAAQGLWNAIRPMLEIPTAAATATFDELISLAWVPLAAAALTGAGQSSGSAKVASQATWVVRDTAFKFMRFIILEHTEGYVGHSPTGLTLGPTPANTTNDLNGVETLAGEPFNWQVSRGRRYILASGAIAGLTYDLNDKLKRGRGLE